MHLNEIGELDKKSIPIGSCPDCQELIYCRREIGKYMIDKQKVRDARDELFQKLPIKSDVGFEFKLVNAFIEFDKELGL